ncbi:dihydroxyacetone kinase subunit DhaL [Planococcus lenghuensis]|uniref:phosphoenolpyruvate--glycerone phosphotransferase n=1 Tax=Planococcus lenghuensis TaxID=2213202 RepID=A0A1Q2L384_9BACL|nr:dihydroxyacetone kinase subunit DhaL [Planococcus lenghuensis]AQQ54873.1 dihydroxyacetone kinase subunit L [Planococcus lenghuensis]
MGLKVEDVKAWIMKTNEQIQQNKEYLSELDQAIGDGDHGTNISRGFQETVNKISSTEYTAVADLIKDWSMTLLSKVGGAAGPLFGTALLKFSGAVQGKEEIDYGSFVEGVEAGLNGLILRGKAEEGDKTMVDVWSPLLTYLKGREALDADDFEEAAKAAMENTKNLKAKKGRASYLGDRSIGHLDPGSVSSYYLFSSLAQVIKEEGVQL